MWVRPYWELSFTESSFLCSCKVVVMDPLDHNYIFSPEATALSLALTPSRHLLEPLTLATCVHEPLSPTKTP